MGNPSLTRPPIQTTHWKEADESLGLPSIFQETIKSPGGPGKQLVFEKSDV